MQVVTGYQNGYPMPGGIAGSLSRGVYKYGGRNLQVGVWATGQQPFTVKKLTVREPELWPRNSQTVWNRPRVWRRI